MSNSGELYMSGQEILNHDSSLNSELTGLGGINMNYNVDLMLADPFTPQLPDMKFNQDFTSCFGTNTKKRARWESESTEESNLPMSSATSIESNGDLFALCDEDMSGLSVAEIKRQIHIQSEQKRRAQIRDGFEELRMQLPTPPGTSSKQPSKATILSRTISYLQHMNAAQSSLLMEIERLRMENSHLKYAHAMSLQSQSSQSQSQPDMKALNSLYSIGI